MKSNEIKTSEAGSIYWHTGHKLIIYGCNFENSENNGIQTRQVQSFLESYNKYPGCEQGRKSHPAVNVSNALIH